MATHTPPRPPPDRRLISAGNPRTRETPRRRDTTERSAAHCGTAGKSRPSRGSSSRPARHASQMHDAFAAPAHVQGNAPASIAGDPAVVHACPTVRPFSRRRTSHCDVVRQVRQWMTSAHENTLRMQ